VLVDVQIHSVFNVPVHHLCLDSYTFSLHKNRAKTTNISGRREYVCERLEDINMCARDLKILINDHVNMLYTLIYSSTFKRDFEDFNQDTI
jgi:hypothetical protein